MLNVEDSHTVGYSLRKLVRAGLLTASKEGKETFYATSPLGADACEGYREVREQCLLGSVGAFLQGSSELSAVARVLRTLSGLYDQAARSATSL